MQVYFNLHKRAWSIKNPKTGLVVNKNDRTPTVVLTNVTFKVSEAGRQRVIAEKRKNVHAYAVGEVQESTELTEETQAELVRVSYNPYKAGHFVRVDTGEPVYSAKLLRLRTGTTMVGTGFAQRIPVVEAIL